MSQPPASNFPLNTSRSWTLNGITISTDASRIPIPTLIEAFDSEELYWAKGLPESVIREMLDGSLNFGVYSPTPTPASKPEKKHVEGTETGSTTGDSKGVEIPKSHHLASSSSSSPPSASPADTSSTSQKSHLIGFARGVTDRVTFLYLTDVYIDPAWQGHGLGKWLVSCVQEVVLDMPYLRRSMLITGQHGTPQESERRKRFYRELMAVEEVGGSAAALSWRGPGCCF